MISRWAVSAVISKSAGKAFPAYNQGVIASGFKGIRQGAEYAVSFVHDRGCFTVHDPVRPDDFAAENMPNTLVPQTHPQYRSGRSEPKNQIVADAGIQRGPRSGRDTDSFRMHLGNFIQSNLVVSV